MEKYYTIEVAGVTRNLPIMQISDSLAIASFVILGDCEIVTKSARLLEQKLPEIDYIVTAEPRESRRHMRSAVCVICLIISWHVRALSLICPIH